MHGFKNGTDFTVLKGLEVQQICLGLYETQIRFQPSAYISMEGRYIHQVADGREILQIRSSCGPNELFRLLGESVTEVDVVSPDTLCLLFSNSDVLLLIDDSEQYESFVIGSNSGVIVI